MVAYWELLTVSLVLILFVGVPILLIVSLYSHSRTKKPRPPG